MSLPEQIERIPLSPGIAAMGPSRFFNRELSWLNFNRRVLEESENERNPLLERLRFLSISANNLDEFYMVRVAGLRGQVVSGIETPSEDGLTPAEQLDRINRSVVELTAEQQECWVTLISLLADAGIHVLHADQLSDDERAWLEDHFLNHIFPVLTPIAVDPAHPFPFIPNFGFTLGLELVREGSLRAMHALMPIPSQLSRFIRFQAKVMAAMAKNRSVSSGSRRWSAFSCRVYFPATGCAARALSGCCATVTSRCRRRPRISCGCSKSALKRRRRGSVIRLEIEATMPSRLQRFVMQELKVTERESFVQKGLIGLADTNQLIVPERPELFEPFVSRFPERIREHHGDCFAAIRKKDIVVHHPTSPSMSCFSS